MRKKAFEKWGAEAQIDMMIEEMAELTFTLLKYRREVNRIAKSGVVDEQNVGTEPILINNVQEEIADVKIMAAQMAIIFGKDEVNRWTVKKMARLETRLKDR